MCSCGVIKYIPANEKLYIGATVTVNNGVKTKFTKRAKRESVNTIRPKPNGKTLGIQMGLWVHYKTQNYKKGFKHWVGKKLGETPVYASNTDAEIVSKAIDTRLYNLGFFDSYTTYELKQDSHSMSIQYFVNINTPYIIGELLLPKPTDTLSSLLIQLSQNSLIKTGMQYNLDILKNERNRIDDALKELGFYYFNSDYLLFKIDTTLGNRSIKISVSVKPETPITGKTIYKIEAVNIFADYKLGKENTIAKRIIDSINYYSEIDYIKPGTIFQSVFLQNNKTYSRKDHDLTLSRLTNLGVYKFVNVKFVNSDSLTNGLKANILLTKLPQKSLTMEAQGVAKSNNFVGPGLIGSYRNRNALGGAELFIFNLRTAFETQFSGPFVGQFTIEITPKVELYVPRFILPFKLRTQSMYVPRTRFSFELSYFSRVNYYDVNSAKFSFGYKWKHNLAIDHDLSVVNLNYFNIFNKSAEFESLLIGNPTLALRYEKQFITGIGYSFYYNQQVYPKLKRPIYFNANFELAGNMLSGINRLNGKIPNSETPIEIFGVKYAQYVRLDIDLRQFFKLNKQGKSMVATRLFAGWGLPFGNASTIPFIKQYFGGGPYSLRGFPIFGLGPGSYLPPDSLNNLYFVQQGGEIRLEANIEYRYTIAGMVKGAFFIDAGNTWLNNENKDIPGGKFYLNTFYTQIAASIGTGIRFDLQFFIFRLDLGIPIRKPYLPQGERWVINSFNISNSSWRQDNLLLNLAFGYPF